MKKTNKKNLKKIVPLVTALCVLVLTVVGCRHNVVLQELLRNRDKRTAPESIYPDAYYVRADGDDDKNDGIAYSTPYKTLNKAMNMVQASGGKTNRVIVIGELHDGNNGNGYNMKQWNGDGNGMSEFRLEDYGTKENPITIGGMSGAKLTSGSGSCIMSIGNNSYLNFENITFTGAKTHNSMQDRKGGGLYINGADSRITLSNGARIVGNECDNGGGVAIENGQLIINGAEISKNTATGMSNCGGGLYAGGNAVVTINSGTITVNKADDYGLGLGGGIYITGSASFIMKNGSIYANTAYNGGGGIYFEGNTFTMTGGTISANTAGNGGGGIYFAGGTVEIKGGSIQGNSLVGGYGGGISIAGGSFTMRSPTTVSENKADNGGGIFIKAGTAVQTVQLLGGIIQGNKAKGSNSTTGGRGGGIYSGNISGSTPVNWTLNGAEIKGNNALNASGGINMAGRGGGVYVGDSGIVGGKMTFTKGKIHSNTAAEGDAIYCGDRSTVDGGLTLGYGHPDGYIKSGTVEVPAP